MKLYYYLFLATATTTIVLFVRFRILKKENIPITLFAQALKTENSGHLEQAVIAYQYALAEVKKIRFHGDLRKKIVQKLKILNTIIEYDKNCHFMR